MVLNTNTKEMGAPDPQNKDSGAAGVLASAPADKAKEASEKRNQIWVEFVKKLFEIDNVWFDYSRIFNNLLAIRKYEDGDIEAILTNGVTVIIRKIEGKDYLLFDHLARPEAIK